MTTYLGILAAGVAILILMSYVLSHLLSFKCPHWRYCNNYQKDSYTCDYSDDEYRHRCYRRKEDR